MNSHKFKEETRRLETALGILESENLTALTVIAYRIDNHFRYAEAVETNPFNFLDSLPDWVSHRSETFVARVSRVMEAVWGFDVIEPYPIGVWYPAKEEDSEYYRRVNEEADGDLSGGIVRVLMRKFPETFLREYGRTEDTKKAYSNRWDRSSIVIFRYGVNDLIRV